MSETLQNTLLLWFVTACDAVGLSPVTVAMSLVGLVASAVSGCGTWLAARLAKRLAALGWRGAKATWRWAMTRREVSDVCVVVLGALNARDLKLEFIKEGGEEADTGDCRASRAAASFDLWLRNDRVLALYDGAKPSSKVLVLRIKSPAGKGPGPDVLRLLNRRERRLVCTAAGRAGLRVQQENADYDRMEIIDALTPPVAPPSHTVAVPVHACNPCWTSAPAMVARAAKQG